MCDTFLDIFTIKDVIEVMYVHLLFTSCISFL